MFESDAVSANESVRRKRKWSDVGGSKGCDHEFGAPTIRKHISMCWECKQCKMRRKVTFVQDTPTFKW